MTAANKIAKEFLWGEVIAVHKLGEYIVVEYKTGPRLFGSTEEPRVSFHPYIDEADTHHSYGSLDAAIAAAIAIKHDGINTKADQYFLRAIGALECTPVDDDQMVIR